MKTTGRAATVILLLAVLLLTSAFASGAQQVSGYADTTADFQRFLQDILDATKKRDRERVRELLKSSEVPDCDAWLHRMYKSDSADSWMSLCDAKTLRSNEKSLAELFSQFARENGELSTRKVNDNPHGGENGFESAIVKSGKEPLEVYFASWKSAYDGKNAEGQAIGYFYYLAGGFRWDSLVSFPKVIKVTNAKVVPAKLIKKVDPVYSADVAARSATGTVRVYYVIGGDGKVYNAHAISGKGLSEDPSLRKAAEDAVLQWRYEPATLDGKPIETNAVTVDLAFPPKN
jgi:hypothetical protein